MATVTTTATATTAFPTQPSPGTTFLETKSLKTNDDANVVLEHYETTDKFYEMRPPPSLLETAGPNTGLSTPASSDLHTNLSAPSIPLSALPKPTTAHIPQPQLASRDPPSTPTLPKIPLETTTIAPSLPLTTRLKSTALRVSSFTLSLGFLSIIASAAVLCHLPATASHIFYRLTFRNRDAKVRPFYINEQKLAAQRTEIAAAWTVGNPIIPADGFIPTEGGPDRLLCDVAYYARCVGLDSETVLVTTDDGFIIELWHIFDPRTPRSSPSKPSQKYPVLLIHGLLQSSGAFCVSDDASLAFDLCKSGYDVWLGNNRCGFNPRHTQYSPSDPRMWAWDIREMATLDLPALVDKVLAMTGHKTLGLVCHSQGTAQTLLALSRDFVPELSRKISAVCALAPAAYAGPLVRKPWFRFMSCLPRPFWRLIFGIHSFIPIMMTAHLHLSAKLYGSLGYVVFSFLFGWTDTRWDQGLRTRMFQFAPVHVSSGLMAWWLGRGGFAHQGSILQNAAQDPDAEVTPEDAEAEAWYPAGTPPIGLWICGSDGLVDGEKLLRRLQGAREPWAEVAFAEVLEGYEHLDVLWAMDAGVRVNEGVKRVLWKTCPVKGECLVPRGVVGESEL